MGRYDIPSRPGSGAMAVGHAVLPQQWQGRDSGAKPIANQTMVFDPIAENRALRAIVADLTARVEALEAMNGGGK